jgi:uncharacterized protein (TIGR02996 family)
MLTRDDLVREVLANPDDAGARGVLADWLAENGQHEAADLMRSEDGARVVRLAIRLSGLAPAVTAALDGLCRAMLAAAAAFAGFARALDAARSSDQTR